MRLKTSKFVAVIVPALVGGWAGCGDDRPAAPTTPPKDYIVYMWDRASHYLAYHAATGRLDTLPPEALHPSDLDVAADGKRLYIRRSDTVTILDASDYSVLGELPYPGRGPVTVSPDNQHLVISTGDLYLLRTSDYAVVYHDTDAVTTGCFSADGGRFYATGAYQGCQYVYRLDLTTHAVTRTCLPDGYQTFQILASLDEKFLFLYRRIMHDMFWFDVYDVAADSFVFRKILIPGFGKMTLGLQGSYVYFSSPGQLNSDNACFMAFFTYDITNRTVDSTYAEGRCLGYRIGFVCQELVITPDGRYLIGFKHFSPFGMLYDLQADAVTASICLDLGTCGTYLTCQTFP
ncbi:MAG TPA: hypothetical protein VMY05_11150 [Acidobacteriota bacterium]|nr:hypothetical protein [Acidobacteriota bacterium]